MKEEPEGGVITRIAAPADVKHVYPILEEMERSARARGTGIARRTAQSLCKKIYEGKAVIALAANGDWAGFSYIESWSDGEFVSNSGLIVNPTYRNSGVATAVKQQVFALGRKLFPTAKIFSITTGAAILKLNHRLGFEPVTYSEITGEDRFWEQCTSCVNHPILESQGRKRCLCTAMLFRPESAEQLDAAERAVLAEHKGLAERAVLAEHTELAERAVSAERRGLTEHSGLAEHRGLAQRAVLAGHAMLTEHAAATAYFS